MGKFIQASKNISKRHPRVISMLIALTYVFFACYYLGPSITNCNDTLYGFGDNTAGPVWRFGLKPAQSPLGSFTDVTNFPVGDNLYTPVNYSLSGQSYLLWGASKVAGPVCGYNIVTVLGFALSALTMFGFIYAVTKRRSIALLAGYAVAFTPYYQMKVGGHPGYGFQALLIGIVWAFYNLIKYQRKKDGIILAALVAFCFYFDPYFSLLAIACLVPLIIAWGLVSWSRLRAKKLKKSVFQQQAKALAVSAVLSLLLLLPLATILVSKSHEITSSVAALRGNVLAEARACSNLPHEYALPFVLHPTFRQAFGDTHYIKVIDQLHENFSCGIGEDTVGISLVVLAVVASGITVAGWEVLNRRKLKTNLGYDSDLVILGLITIGFVGMVMAFPPFKIGEIPTPSYVLLMLTSTWRTLTRFYVVVNFASVALFSVFLAIIASQFKQYKRLLIVGFCLLASIIFVEYQAFKPFIGNGMSTFSYSKDVPQVYKWLKDQKDINEIAEYPLERAGGESNAMAYYLSMQVAHGKKLLNGNVPTTYEESLRSSLKDLSDPQTLNVLKAIGIDAVVVHGIEESKLRQVPQLEILYSAPQSPFNILAYTPLVKIDNTIVVRIKDASIVSQMIKLESGFVRNGNIIRSSIDWEYEAINDSVMKIVDIPGLNSGSKHSAAPNCFAIRMSGVADTAELNVKVDGQKLPGVTVGPAYQRLRLSAKEKIELSNSKGFNMRVKDLGCSKEES